MCFIFVYALCLRCVSTEIILSMYGPMHQNVVYITYTLKEKKVLFQPSVLNNIKTFESYILYIVFWTSNVADDDYDDDDKKKLEKKLNTNEGKNIEMEITF